MNHTLKPSVEPLSDAAWSRIEAGVFARLERGEHLAPAASADVDAPASGETRVAHRPLRAWRLGATIAAASIAAAAAVSLWLHADTLREHERGGAPLAGAAPSEGVAEQPAAQPGDAPSDGARVADGAHITTTDAPRRLQVGDSEVTLAEASVLGVAGDDAHGFRLTLERGRVDCQIAPRAGRPAFVVDAGEARVTVIGTRFSVAREPSGTHVDVAHGTVRVTTPDTSVLLGAGQSWPTPQPDAERPSPATEAQPAPAPPSRRTTASADPAARFERAARLESSSPDAALRIYRQLSETPGPWAANALYAAARLNIEHHHLGRGRSLLEQYLARYPRGANAADARELLDRR